MKLVHLKNIYRIPNGWKFKHGLSTLSNGQKGSNSGGEKGVKEKSDLPILQLTYALNTLKNSLRADQKRYLEQALRINHAGEVAAVRIYTSQTPLVTQAFPHMHLLMYHMQSQEETHLTVCSTFLRLYNGRPSLLLPVWRLAGSTLGWITGLLGRQAAMACTEAVETVIGSHYGEQVALLTGWINEILDREKVQYSTTRLNTSMQHRTQLALITTHELMGCDQISVLTYLRNTFERFRQEELEHLDTAVAHDSHLASSHELLTSIIKKGCTTAINICRKY